MIIRIFDSTFKMDSYTASISKEEMNSIKSYSDHDDWKKLTTPEKTRFFHIRSRIYNTKKSAGGNNGGNPTDANDNSDGDDKDEGDSEDIGDYDDEDEGDSEDIDDYDDEDDDESAHNGNCLDPKVPSFMLEKKNTGTKSCANKEVKVQKGIGLPGVRQNVEKKCHECPHCGYWTTTKSNVQRHVNAVHTKKRPFQCPQCEYRAARSSNVKRHVNAVHMNRKLFQCPHCDYRAVRSGDVKRHANAVHMKRKL